MFERPPEERTNLKPDSLAILRSCKLINAEIGNSWLGLVTFYFPGVDRLLDKLSALPRATLGKIRYIRVYARYAELDVLSEFDGAMYQMSWALRLLPSLCLNLLTVFDGASPEVAYRTLDRLVKYGHGWKELHYTPAGSFMLGFGRVEVDDEPPIQRKPQPSAWSCDLAERDGADSGVSVTIHRAISYPLDASDGALFAQRLSPRDSVEIFGINQDPSLTHNNEEMKELRITVRRGRNADIADMPEIPLLNSNKMEWPGERTWKQIQEEFRPLEGWCCSCCADIDTYKAGFSG
ncbi:uncharacterized protein BDV14DRAFT_206230 [Aspergillus stella-maris]|uniref:uncharacterized protein n=1 Tax=Aspergillus stella-maris TaxID=1810926 RepID=UPI003CCE0BC9